MMKNPWTTKSVEEVYNNPWIRITHREVTKPGGGDGIYGVVHFKNMAIGIVPLDENNNTWLVGQYRYTIDRYSWEIPEGGCPLGTDTLETARRELREETGIIAGEWTRIIDFYTSNSVTDEYGQAYLARDLSFGPAAPEDTEDLQIKKLPFREAIDMVLNGEITDALSIMALLRVEIWLEQAGDGQQ